METPLDVMLMHVAMKMLTVHLFFPKKEVKDRARPDITIISKMKGVISTLQRAARWGGMMFEQAFYQTLILMVLVPEKNMLD